MDEFLSPTSPDEGGRNERDGDVMRSGIKTRESCADSCSGSNVEETHAEQDSRDPLDGSSMLRSLTDSFPPEGYVTHRRRCLCIVCVHNCVISVAIARL